MYRAAVVRLYRTMDRHTVMDTVNAGLPIFTIESFSRQPFGGNPAAVCLTLQGLSDKQMQKIAAEMNLSETSFVTPMTPGETFADGSRFGLRWWTPKVEVNLCGHATLAAAAALFYCMGNPNKKLVFSTLSGDLTAVRDGDFICLDLPLNPPEPYTDHDTIAQLTKLAVPNPDLTFKDIQYSPATKKLLLRLADHHTRADLEQLCPRIDQFVSSVPTEANIAGVIVTLKGSAESQYDFVSRYFAPWVGIPEDPVTGSAHTVLAGYWSKHLGKTTLCARQCSSRGGDLRLTLKDNNRLEVAGPATVILRGYLDTKCLQPSS